MVKARRFTRNRYTIHMDAFGLAIGTFLFAMPHLAMGQGGLVCAWPGLPFPGELLAVILASAVAPLLPKRVRMHLPAALLVAGAALAVFEAWCLGQGHAGMNAIVIGLVEEILHGGAVALWVVCLRLEDNAPSRKLPAFVYAAAALGAALWYVGIRELQLGPDFTLKQADLVSWGLTLVWSIDAVIFLMLTAGDEGGFPATLAVFGGVLQGNRTWWVLDGFGIHAPLSGVAIIAVAVLSMAAAAALAQRSPTGSPTDANTDDTIAQQGLLPTARADEASLTAREREVIELALAGATVDETAEQLGIARATAGTYRSRALTKLDMRSVQEFLATLRQDEGVTAQLGNPEAEPHFPLWNARSAIVAAALVSIGTSLRLVPSNQVVTLILVAAFTCAFVAGIVIIVRDGQTPCPSNGPVSLLIGTACALIVAGCAYGPAIYLVRRIVVACFVSYAALLALGEEGLAETLTWFGLTGLVLALPGPHVSVVASSAGWATGTAAFFALSAHLIRGLKRERRLADLANASLEADERTLAYLRGRGLGELEARVALLTAQGFDRASVAGALSVSPSTVASYRSAAYAALGVNDRRALAAKLSEQAGLNERNRL